jgi:acetyl-CoA C-acetyltransferase
MLQLLFAAVLHNLKKEEHLGKCSDSKLESMSQTNVNGSGISLGHPIGATGTMRLTTLIHEMTGTDSR